MQKGDTGFLATQDGMKSLALVCMFLSHVSRLLPEDALWLARLFTGLGYFTAPVMCWCLVEGFYRTRSRRRYFLRLLCFAALSQVPYMVYFGRPYSGNMLCTLALCFLVLQVRYLPWRRPVRWIAVFVLMFLTAFCDWPYLAVLLVLWLDTARGMDGHGQGPATVAAFALFAFLLFLFQYFGTDSALGLDAMDAAASAAMAFPACAYAIRAVPGRPSRGKRVFFYGFYPAHLALLCVVRLAIELL